VLWHISPVSFSSMEKDRNKNSPLNIYYSLYPNPSNGKFIVETNDELSYIIELYNLLGEKVCEKFVSNKQEIDMQQLASGTYIVKIIINEVVIKTERVSIIH
jgi:hypothetical protein